MPPRPRRLLGRDLTEMGLLAANGAVGFTDGVQAVADALVMRRVLAYARTFDLLVLQHPEEPSLARAGEVNEGEIATRLGLPAIPPAAEVIMIERDLRLVEITGARYHVAHVSTAAAVEAIRRAKAQGLPVTCDTAPPYFVLNETAIGDYRTFAKLSPPLRSEWDRRAVVEGLARRHDRCDRQRPCAVGPGFEAPAVQLGGLRHRRARDVAAAVARALPQWPSRPARSDPAADFGPGRHSRACRRAGWQPARPPISSCSTRICLGASRTDEFRSKSKNAPFDGRPVKGRVRRTIVDGRTIFGRAECRRTPSPSHALGVGPLSRSAGRAALSPATNSPSPALRERVSAAGG